MNQALLGRRECVLMLGEVLQSLVAMSSSPDEEGEFVPNDAPVREAVQTVVMVERGDLGGEEAVREEWQRLADGSDVLAISTSVIYSVACGLAHFAHEADVAQALRWYAENDELWEAVCNDLKRQAATNGLVTPSAV